MLDSINHRKKKLHKIRILGVKTTRFCHVLYERYNGRHLLTLCNLYTTSGYRFYAWRHFTPRILLTFIKLPFTFVLYIFEWPLKPGFTVQY